MNLGLPEVQPKALHCRAILSTWILSLAEEDRRRESSWRDGRPGWMAMGCQGMDFKQLPVVLIVQGLGRWDDMFCVCVQKLLEGSERWDQIRTTILVMQ